MTGMDHLDSGSFWRKVARVFDDRAAEYDGWYEDSLLFRIELAALEDIRTRYAGPMVELGVGPGRFAEQLGVDFGIDPALAPLVLAAQRGVRACQATGEHLPFKAKSLGTVFLLFTLCFLARPQEVLRECARVLRPGGHLVLALVSGASPWGKFLAAKGAQGYPFYRFARFYAVDTALAWLTASGFVIVEQRATLQQPPEAVVSMERSVAGAPEGAGLIILVAARQ